MTALTLRRRGAGAKGSKYLMTATSNPEVFTICVTQGWCSSEGMTYEEAGSVTGIWPSIFYGNTDIVSFDELEFFTGLNNGLIGLTATTANGVFQNCTSLESIKLPANLKAIGVKAFSGCTSLHDVKIPSGVTRIYESAFLATNLVYIDIPSSVRRIDWGVFRNSANIQYVKVLATTPPTLAASNFTGGNYYNAPIYVPDESVELYKTATNWSALASRIRPISEFVIGYIQDGLVFHMNGLNKGSNSDYWTDTIGGLQFAYVNGVTPSNNGVVLESGHEPFVMPNTGIDFPYTTHTIEIVCSSINGMLFFNSAPGQIALGRLQNGLVYGVGNTTTPTPIANGNIPSCISVSNSESVINGVSVQRSGSPSSWSGDSSNVITIGGRSLRTDYKFVGTIYDIRIYNRKLSIEEMIYNQKIDNDRYSLGIVFQE